MKANEAAASERGYEQKHNRRHQRDVSERAEQPIPHPHGEDLVRASGAVNRPPAAGAKSADFRHCSGAVGADHAGT